jgi:hypothetical protein
MKKIEDLQEMKPFKVLHIDQHSDIKANVNKINIKHVKP